MYIKVCATRGSVRHFDKALQWCFLRDLQTDSENIPFSLLIERKQEKETQHTEINNNILIDSHIETLHTHNGAINDTSHSKNDPIYKLKTK